MRKIPRALERDTIVECVSEIRFSSAHESAESLIPGMVFGALSNYFDKSIPLPLAQLPKVVREKQTTLQYQATNVLEGQDLKFLLGGRIAAVSFSRPYPGWARARPMILECLGSVLKTGMVKEVERVSIKYTNLISQGRDEYDLSQLNVSLSLNDFELSGPGLEMKAEIRRNDCITIVQVMSGAKVAIKSRKLDETATGVLLNVDTIRMGPIDLSGADLPAVLDKVHSTEKEIFFGLLNEGTFEKLGPIWD